MPANANDSLRTAIPSAPPALRPRRNGLACQRCHAHKIKCSGGNPCRGCMRSNKATECVYLGRQKKVLVLESYIKELEAENEKSKQLVLQAHAQASPEVYCCSPRPQNHNMITIKSPPAPELQGPDEEDVAQAQVVTPVIEQRHSNKSMSRPVYIGAAACTAFADLLWRHVQTTAESQPLPAPSRQVRLFNDSRLCRKVHANFELPSHTYATILVQVVLKFVGNDYHFVKKKSFLHHVDEVYQMYETSPQSVTADPMFLCRMFIIFALGELYLKKTALAIDGERTVPGTSFYLQAVSLFEELYEEPSIEYIETLLLMSFYSHALNRKNSAYTYSGIALRLGVSMGLHRNMTYDATKSPEEIENRRRVWWTVYIFDRLCSSKLGHPVMLKDEDIDAPLPSSEGLPPEVKEDFVDAKQLVANIQLSQITGTLLDHTYKIHKPNGNTFISDIHSILTRLKTWDATLSPELRLDHSKSPPYASRSVASLRLHFNQCMILATRPVLLFVFKCYVGTPNDAHKSSPLPMTVALSEACIYAARATNRLLKQLWIDGNIATFGYFDAHYIFSSTIVLVMSNILNPNNTDKESIGLSLQLLQSMSEDGNMPAQELYDRLSFLKKELNAMCLSSGMGPDKGYVSPSGTFAAHIVPGAGKVNTVGNTTGVEDASKEQPLTAMLEDQNPSLESNMGSTFLEGPFLRDFLEQPYSEWSPSAFGMTNDEIGISSLAHDIEIFSNIEKPVRDN